MILSALRPLKVLSLIWLVLISTTIIIPGIVLSYLPSWTANYVEVRIITYIVWVVIAVYSVAFAVRDDRSKVDQRVDRKLEGLSQEVQQLQEDHVQATRQLSGFQNQVEYLNNAVRFVFQEMGVRPPPHSVSPQGAVSFNFAVSSAVVTVKHSRKVVRFIHWVNRQARRLWKLLVG